MNKIFQQKPAPKTILGRHRILAPSAAVRVSPICLGAMNFGDAWKDYLGECNKETTFEILDYFFEQGGNFIDTANNYQNEESEKWLGEWMEKRGNRDEMVIATKYSTSYRSYVGHDGHIHANTAGNSYKSMRVSVEASLKKLKTSYIDVLYIHWWDHSTSIEEVMQGLNTLVQEGKILYLGISDTPAWIVSKANQYARDHGLRQFVVYQGRWSAGDRDFERDILPMCAAEGMGIAPWGALGGGAFKTEEQRKTGEGRQRPASETAIKVSKVLEKVAKDKKTDITSVALAYVMHKAPNVFPICGGRKLSHLKGNIEALGLTLTPEEIKEIEGGYDFDIGFPLNMLGAHPSQSFLLGNAGNFDYVDGHKPVVPGQLAEK